MINRRLALLVMVVMSTVALAFGGTHANRASARKHPRTMSAHMNVSAQNQFHFPASKGRGALIAQRQAEQRPLPMPGFIGLPHAGTAHSLATSKHRPTRAGIPGPPPSSIGFVSATQIPAGGYLTGETLPADFNGDGIPDLVSIVGDPSNSGNFYFSVVLGNGDGTFQAPVLTAAPGNTTDPFGIGDVNNDGLDDVVFVHQPGASANFDVLLSNGDGTFTVGNNYALGSNNLSGGGVADFDGDGKLDLVAVDSASPGNVWVATGNGDGTFNSATSIQLSEQAGYDVIIADLNGDGMLDITGNDNVTGHQKVFLATSPTQFAAAASYTTSDGIYDACATRLGDLNGDGKPEIVSANCTDNTITIYVNDGSGGFGQGVYYNVSAIAGTAFVPQTNPVATSIADVNGDGHADVIVTNTNSGDVTVLLGNGDGTVNVPSVGYAVGGTPGRPAIVADLNGDGLADIVVPDDRYSLVYMKGYGDGTFQAAVDTYAPASDGGAPQSLDIATGDLNGDGLADVVVGNCCDSTVGVTVFLANPNGGMQPGVNYGSGGGMSYVAIADLDGDGKLDIAASDSVNGVVQIFKGDGNGGFTVGSSYSTGAGTPQPAAVVVGDFNHDGYPDLAVANFNTSDIGVLLNDGSGGFLPATNYPVCSSTNQISVADINGDGFADLVAPLPACTGVAVLLNVGDGSGTFLALADLGVGNRPYQIAIGDLNGDGFPDLAITRDDFVHGHGVTVALNDGTGVFTVANAVVYPTSLQIAYYKPLPTYIRLADLDGDGKLDLVYTNTNYGTVGVMYGVGDGTFFDPVEYPTSERAFGLALGDVNGDGAPDAVTALDFTAGVTTLLNNSGTGAAPDYTVASNPTTQTVSAGASGVYTITLTPRNFYNGTVSFTCGTLPSKTTCSFSNPTLTPNGNGAMTTTLTLKTTAPVTTMAATGRSGIGLVASLMGVGLFGLMLAGDWRNKSRRLGIVLTVVAVGLVITLVGCGGSSAPQQHQTIPGTPTGSYTVTVTATGTAGTNSGSTAPHVVNLTLNVQ